MGEGVRRTFRGRSGPLALLLVWAGSCGTHAPNETGAFGEASKCTGGTNGDTDYCAPGCQCSAGEGDCDSDADCSGGNVCAALYGPKFGLGSTIDVCVPSSCTNGTLTAGEAYIDCGGTSSCGVCNGQVASVSAGDSSDQNVAATTVDSSGNIYVLGSFVGTITFNGNTLTSAGSYDIFLVKYNSGGTYQWSHSYGGTGADFGVALTTDSASNVLIAGSIRDDTMPANSVDFNGTSVTPSVGEYDAFIAKIDSSGNTSWVKAYGDENFQRGEGLATDSSNNVYALVWYQGTVSPGGSCSDQTAGVGVTQQTLLMKLNSSGTCQLIRRLGSGTNNARAQGIAINSSDKIWVVGRYESSMDLDTGVTLTGAGSWDAFVAQYDTSLAFTHPWGMGNDSYASGGNASEQHAWTVALDSSDNVYIGGYFAGTMNLANCGMLTSQGGFDAFIVKLGSTGTCLAEGSWGDASDQLLLSLAVGPNGEVLSGGEFAGSMTWTGTTITSSGGGSDRQVYDAWLNLLYPLTSSTYTTGWSAVYGTASNEDAFSDAAFSATTGQAVVVGDFSGNINIGGTTFTGSGQKDVLIARLASDLHCVNSARTNSPFAGGAGSASDPYRICTAAQLDRIGNNSTDNGITSATKLSASYRLDEDIDLSSYTGTTFHRIGDFSTVDANTIFFGSFDGNDHTITGFTYSSGSTDYVGLFGYASGSTIKDLTLSGATVTGRDQTGSLIGLASSSSTITGITTSGAISITGRNYTGGLAGYLNATTLTDVVVGGTVTITSTGDRVGGLAGTIDGNGALGAYTKIRVGSSGTHATLSTSGTLIGGLAGLGAVHADGLTVDQAAVYADVTCSGGNFIGVVIGEIAGLGVGTASITNTYGIGTATSTAGSQGNYLGGFTGVAYGIDSSHKVTIQNCFVDADVNGGSNLVVYNAGFIGLVFQNDIVSNNFTLGDEANGTSFYGFFLGRDLASNTTVSGNYYYSGATCSGCNTNGATSNGSLSYFYDKDNAPLSNWDFTTIWQETDGNNDMTPDGLPTLRNVR